MILDTNAVSALAARDPALMARLRSARSMELSFISIAEFEYGLLGSNRPDAGRELLRNLVARVPVLYPDASTLRYYAELADHLKRSGRPIPQNDMWTAALARQHELPVLSRDRHFDFVPGLERLGW